MTRAEQLAAETGTINVGYRGRVRTGCLTCRASKVRCDEQHPACKRCIRLSRTCVYNKNTPSRRSSRASATSTDRATSKARGSSSQLDQVIVASSPTLLDPTTTDSSVGIVSFTEGTPCSRGHHRGRSEPRSPMTSTGSPSLLSMMVSQDIYLCTTIDLMVANETSTRPSFTYFQQSVNSPYITPYDPISWQCFKDHVVHLASHNTPVVAALLAVQSLYKAQGNGLSISKALSLYEAASHVFQAVLSKEDEVDQEVLLSLGFLLYLVEMLLPEDTGPSPLRHPEGPFVSRLQAWANGTHHRTLAVRISSWLLLCHAAARRGGNSGVLAPPGEAALRVVCCKAPTLPPVSLYTTISSQSAILQFLTEPLYAFHLQLQLLSSQVADLSHYHRSRVTSEDQEEVFMLIADLKGQMERLWDSRPSTMQSLPADIRGHLSQQVSEPFLLLIGIYEAIYHTEIVEIGRNLSDPPFASPEAREHLARIRAIIESPEYPTASVEDPNKIHVAFLRPLFLYAIESIYQAETEWAVDQIRKIKDPTSRSDFFASFAEGLATAQREKGRRVTTKWWCLQAFNVAPPYL